MKKLMLLATTILCTALAHAGGDQAPGGGRISQRSPDEIAKNLNDVKSKLSDLFHVLGARSEIIPTQLKPLVQKMLTGDEHGTIFQQIKQIFYVPEVYSLKDYDRDPALGCFDSQGSRTDSDGLPFHGGVGSYNRQVDHLKICFDLTQLSESRAIFSDLVVLAAHEHSHLFGADETLAKALQRFIFANYSHLDELIKSKKLFNDNSDPHMIFDSSKTDEDIYVQLTVEYTKNGLGTGVRPFSLRGSIAAAFLDTLTNKDMVRLEPNTNDYMEKAERKSDLIDNYRYHLGKTSRYNRYSQLSISFVGYIDDLCNTYPSGRIKSCHADGASILLDFFQGSKKVGSYRMITEPMQPYETSAGFLQTDIVLTFK